MYLFRFRVTELPIAPVYQLLFTIIGIIGAFILGGVLAKVMIAKHSYTCTECNHHFKVRWYKGAILSFHDEKGRLMKCPNCKKLTLQKESARLINKQFGISTYEDTYICTN